MRFLIDEQLSQTVSAALDVFTGGTGMVSHVRDYVSHGLTDDEIPPLCKAHGIHALVTMNVKDFGAKRHYYAALLDNGIHVVVVRPGKSQPDAGQQLALVANRWTYVEERLTRAQDSTLIRLAWGSAVERSLDEVMAEIQGLP